MEPALLSPTTTLKITEEHTGHLHGITSGSETFSEDMSEEECLSWKSVSTPGTDSPLSSSSSSSTWSIPRGTSSSSPATPEDSSPLVTRVPTSPEGNLTKNPSDSERRLSDVLGDSTQSSSEDSGQSSSENSTQSLSLSANDVIPKCHRTPTALGLPLHWPRMKLPTTFPTPSKLSYQKIGSHVSPKRSTGTVPNTITHSKPKVSLSSTHPSPASWGSGVDTPLPQGQHSVSSSVPLPLSPEVQDPVCSSVPPPLSPQVQDSVPSAVRLSESQASVPSASNFFTFLQWSPCFKASPSGASSDATRRNTRGHRHDILLLTGSLPLEDETVTESKLAPQCSLLLNKSSTCETRTGTEWESSEWNTKCFSVLSGTPSLEDETVLSNKGSASAPSVRRALFSATSDTKEAASHGPSQGTPGEHQERTHPSSFLVSFLSPFGSSPVKTKSSLLGSPETDKESERGDDSSDDNNTQPSCFIPFFSPTFCGSCGITSAKEKSRDASSSSSCPVSIFSPVKALAYSGATPSLDGVALNKGYFTTFSPSDQSSDAAKMGTVTFFSPFRPGTMGKRTRLLDDLSLFRHLSSFFVLPSIFRKRTPPGSLYHPIATLRQSS